MRIGIVTGEYPPMQGGVGDFSRELSIALAHLGHEVHILTRTGCRTDGLITGCTLSPEIEHWGWSVSRRIRRWAMENNLGLINLQYQAAAYDMHPSVNLLSSRTVGAPLVVTFHDLKVPYLFPKAGPLRWQAVLALARRSSGVIVTNREDQLALEPYHLDRPAAVIPIGSNITPTLPPEYDRASWRERWGVGSDETLLGYFGFLNESKGGEDLVQALDRLRKRPVRLMMIGGRTGSSDPSNQAYADRIDALIHDLDLQERVIWTGYTTPAEVSANLLATDLCLLPYRDGASFRRGSFMAALAHGLPIVTTTPAVELPELGHRENIYLVPPAAPDALAQAVIALQQDDALRERLAGGARALSQSFRWDSIARSTVDLFKKLGPSD